jgi:hypothetical protein
MRSGMIGKAEAIGGALPRRRYETGENPGEFAKIKVDQGESNQKNSRIKDARSIGR